MRVKKKLCICAGIILMAVGLYCGISFVATLLHAYYQPYMLSYDSRFDFQGYYMMSVLYAVISIAAGLPSFFLLRAGIQRSN